MKLTVKEHHGDKSHHLYDIKNIELEKTEPSGNVLPNDSDSSEPQGPADGSEKNIPKTAEEINPSEKDFQQAELDGQKSASQRLQDSKEIISQAEDTNAARIAIVKAAKEYDPGKRAFDGVVRLILKLLHHPPSGKE